MRDLTARTALGAVDLVPFLRRDEGIRGVELRDWEREPAALALAGRGWSVERVAYATGLHTPAVRDLLEGRRARTVEAERPRVPLRAVRHAQRVLVDGRWFHPSAPHGTRSGYDHWGCRCPGCSETHAERSAEQRRQAKNRKTS